MQAVSEHFGDVEENPSPPRTASVATLGCKLNQYESEQILAQFRAAGYDVVDRATQADIFVVNTCAVTANAERKARTLLRSYRRQHPTALIVAAGCMAERTPDTLAAMDGVRVVIGNREKGRVLDYVTPGLTAGPTGVHVGGVHRAARFEPSAVVTSLLGRTRTFLKIQDGCSQSCTYCIIPRLRGRGRSLPIADAVAEIQRLVGEGFAEIVLTGVALGTYGRDLGLNDGLSLLLESLREVEGLRRLRLGSVEPWAISDRLLRVMAESEVICPHLHLPLQTADDEILRRMNRRYTVRDIERIFDRSARIHNRWGFGADVIVGFPGESNRSFKATREFLDDSPVSYLHVFPYSPRPGTPALRLPDPVPESETRTRVRIMKDLDADLRRRFREQHIGCIESVLFESRRVGGLLAGHASDYLDVYADMPDGFAGMICSVEVIAPHPNGVIGRTMNEGPSSS
ncbi:tRNA (N(6)-L-threonylcarbamoyladenosine(37)-C(2))-methylthiotransferase MtaB [bacterium]|nr:tRNA (N(6)-L-threonylcarbamoyladenosine(37)-C(2))-methylthiotransferase MtaB [bacterium]MBU1984923.1 tRNA (N(6)-L-threonylcarbamoyladenosine(37)-C(2))-methylthiotransferase MtaB [bacterium]